MRLREAADLLRQTGRDWWEDKAPRLAAALAFYTLFALAPLVVVTIAVVGLAFGQEAVQEALAGQARELFGPAGERALFALVANAGDGRGTATGAALGTAAFLFGASGVFIQLQDALDTVWEVRPRRVRNWRRRLAKRLRAFTMVLGIGFLLLVSLAVSAGLAAIATAGRGLPGADLLWYALDFAVSLGVVALLFALLFRTLPDAVVQWRDAWLGGAVTSLLFAAGKALLALYLGRSASAASFGGASVVAVLLLWVYYNAQLVLFGAEFTQAYARRRGQPIVPKPHAEPLPGEDAANARAG